MRLQNKCAALLVAGAGALIGTGSAQAGYTSYFGEDLNRSDTVPLAITPNSDSARDSFLSKLKSPGTQTFENQATGAGPSLTLSFPGTDSNLSATLSGAVDASVKSVTPGETDGFGRYSVPSATTTKYWQAEAGPVNASSTFVVTFDRPVAAFGFYGIDIGDFGGQLQLLLFDASGQEIDTLTVDNTQGDDGSTDGSVLFFGLVADGSADVFSTVRFRMTFTGEEVDVFGFDNFVVADLGQVQPPNGVPEPVSLALVGAALLCMAATRRRRLVG